MCVLPHQDGEESETGQGEEEQPTHSCVIAEQAGQRKFTCMEMMGNKPIQASQVQPIERVRSRLNRDLTVHE